MPNSSPDGIAFSLPRRWTEHVRAGVIGALSLATTAATLVRAGSTNSIRTRTRLAADLERAENEILLLREQIRIADARLAAIPPHRRPHFPPPERS